MKQLKTGQKVAFSSIILNALLFAAKLWVGMVSNSIALIADAWHTLSDSLSSIIVFISLKICAKPADKDHPFGHGRLDILASIIIGMMLSLVGYHFFSSSLSRLRFQESATYGRWAIIITILSILIKEIMARYSIHFGKKLQTKSLIADGWHHRSDAFSSIVILIGIIIGGKIWWIDGVMGIALSVILFYAAYSVLKNNINTLLGEQISSEMRTQIQDLISGLYPLTQLHPHHIHLHDYGMHKEVTLHILLPAESSLEEAHSITDKIEKELEKKLHLIATIHAEPV